ncbi:MAG: hypothetical protein ACI8Z5_000425 [Lentimonas sp.]
MFIAEVLEAETSLEIETDLVGQEMKAGGVVRVVWTDARRFKLSVIEVFTGEQPDVFEVYNGGGGTLKSVEDYQGALGKIWLPDPHFSWPRPMLLFALADLSSCSKGFTRVSSVKSSLIASHPSSRHRNSFGGVWMPSYSRLLFALD